MALPIKPTPILKGKDAEVFLRKIKENENKKDYPERVRIMTVYNKAKKDWTR
jgi:hypothetical protein